MIPFAWALAACCVPVQSACLTRLNVDCNVQSLSPMNVTIVLAEEQTFVSWTQTLPIPPESQKYESKL